MTTDEFEHWLAMGLIVLVIVHTIAAVFASNLDAEIRHVAWAIFLAVLAAGVVQ